MEVKGETSLNDEYLFLFTAKGLLRAYDLQTLRVSRTQDDLNSKEDQEIRRGGAATSGAEGPAAAAEEKNAPPQHNHKFMVLLTDSNTKLRILDLNTFNPISEKILPNPVRSITSCDGYVVLGFNNNDLAYYWLNTPDGYDFSRDFKG